MLVHHFLARSAERFPDKTALVCGERRLTFTELDGLADRAAGSLVSMGLRLGDRAVVQLENSVEAVAALFGVWKAGGVAVPLHPEIKSRKLETILQDCGAKVHVTGALTPAPLPAPTTRPPGEGRQAGELCSLIYTSGSTGRPRGVALSHGNMEAASGAIIQYLENTPDDVVVDLLPLSFDYGLYNVLMPIRFGGTVVLEKAFHHPGQLIGLLQREGVTGLPLVPAIAAWFVKLRSFAGVDLPALRYITSTGQALPAQHIARLRELFPRARIFSMYGLTECKRVSYLPPEEVDRRPASVGKAMPGTEAWPIDMDGARVTRPGMVGELVVRGPHVMQGYWNLPAETAQALRPDGDPAAEPGARVLHTGDLFRLDDEGFLYWVARRDDLIKTAGQRVSPKEIEAVVLDLDGVAEAAVCGVPDEILGQAVKVAVTLREGAALTAAEILEHCARHLEKHMVPRHVEIRGELPRTATGKIARRALKNATV
jgi:acyl-CoA synthetase (AMP-forming)/AMP-acid ligase II